jgi:hypothetical protein
MTARALAGGNLSLDPHLLAVCPNLLQFRPDGVLSGPEFFSDGEDDAFIFQIYFHGLR